MKLDDQLHKMPKHSIEESLWGKIEAKISASESKTLAQRLPQHTVRESLWFSIDAIINNKARRRSLKVRRFYAAASLLFIVSMSAVYFSNQQPEYLYYSEEVYIENNSFDKDNYLNIDVLDNCSDHPVVCSSPTFTRLKNNLDQLKNEEQKLRVLKASSDNPQLEVYHARIVKNIQEVESQLLEMFI